MHSHLANSGSTVDVRDLTEQEWRALETIAARGGRPAGRFIDEERRRVLQAIAILPIYHARLRNSGDREVREWAIREKLNLPKVDRAVKDLLDKQAKKADDDVLQWLRVEEHWGIDAIAKFHVQEALVQMGFRQYQERRQLTSGTARAAVLLAHQNLPPRRRGAPGKPERLPFVFTAINLWRNLGCTNFKVWARGGEAAPLVDFIGELLDTTGERRGPDAICDLLETEPCGRAIAMVSKRKT